MTDPHQHDDPPMHGVVLGAYVTAGIGLALLVVVVATFSILAAQALAVAAVMGAVAFAVVQFRRR